MPKPVNAIELRTSKNGVIQLTSEKLEQWLAHLESDSQKKSTAMNPHLIGQFGLKDAASVIAFLKTSVGKSVLGIIENQLAEQALLEENVRDAQLASARKHLHRLLFLLLGLLYEEEAQAAQLKNTTQTEIDKKYQQMKTPAKSEVIDSLHETLLHYDQSILALEVALDLKYKESEMLKMELIQLAEAHADIQLRYSIYDQVLGNPEKMAQFSDPNIVTGLQDEIKQQIDSYAQIIAALELEERFDEAREKMHYSTALGLKSSLLEQLAAVHQQRVSLFNRQGQTVDNFDQAEFIVPKGKMLVLDAGNYYLFPQLHEFSQLSVEQKARAREEFVSAKDNITNIKLKLDLKRTVELKFHRDQKDRVTARSTQLQDHIYFLTTQLEKVQSARAQCEAKLSLATKTPIPTPDAAQPKAPRPSPLTKAKKIVSQRNEPTVFSYFLRSLSHLESLLKNTPSNTSALAKQRLTDLRRMTQSPLPDPQSTIANTNTTAPITPITPFSIRPKKS